MRLARFRTADGKVLRGVVREDGARGNARPGGQAGGQAGASLSVIEGDFPGSWKETRRRLPLNEVKLLAPLSPVNILCIGRNYKAHAEEGGDSAPKQPILFLKATSAVIGPDDPIMLPAAAPDQVDYEAELAVVIGKSARRVSEADSLDYVLGYSCANDVTARDCQAREGQWARAKSFETFGPLGPWIETELDSANLRVTGRLNGKTMQDSNTSQLLFSVRFLISYLSMGMTLLPGTVLLTGTPAGCGFARKPPVWMKPGDVYEVEIAGIGILRNVVAAEATD